MVRILKNLRTTVSMKSVISDFRNSTKDTTLILLRTDIIRSYDNAIGTDGSIVILKGNLAQEDAVIKHTACPKEMFYTSEAISSDKELGKSIALITDGRFSGASTGPVIGYCSPEAVDGGPIALVEEDDLIEIDVMERKLNIVGVKGERKSMEEIDRILQERRAKWTPRKPKYEKGVLRLFSQHAASPMKGAYLEY